MTTELHFGSPILAGVHAVPRSGGKGAGTASAIADELVLMAGGGGKNSGVDNRVVRWRRRPSSSPSRGPV